MCASQSDEGGASFLTDGYAALEALRADPRKAWAAERLESKMLELTTTHENFSEDGSPVAFAATKVVETTAGGRKQIMSASTNLRSLEIDSEEDQAQDAEMLKIWKEAVLDLASRTVPFRLKPGQLAIVDNYR